MTLPRSKEQWTRPSASAVQDAAAIVVALATAFSVFTQSREHPRLSWGLFSLALLVVIWTFGKRLAVFFQVRRYHAVRDRAARAEHSELLRFARRLAKFVGPGDPSNLRPIVFSVYGNNEEKCMEVCPSDYMRELFPLFVQHLETRPSENERQFLLAAQELYGLVASYNNNYVLEPFRRMRSERWGVDPTPVQSLLENPNPAKPNFGVWLASLPKYYRANTERQIEDFRERWVGFLDDIHQWLERVNESFDVALPTYFDRPQKL